MYVVSKSGRYDVWLSSATIDTTDLKYKNSVLLKHTVTTGLKHYLS